ncbi:MAG: hypothetical protein M1819_004671 [Sarea resinae]|nr:MAG: hypothetical protein M1819_004671 [Sarea resinae]
MPPHHLCLPRALLTLRSRSSVSSTVSAAVAALKQTQARSLHVSSSPNRLIERRSLALNHLGPSRRIGIAGSRRLQQQQQQRWLSRNESGQGKEIKVKQYGFDDVKALVEEPSKDRILIDVREPSEFSAGAIPTALNMPISSSPDALFLPAEEFEDRFGFPKPDGQNEEVVFYCKAGVRSRAAAKLAVQGGFERVGEFPGSWVEWAGRGGESSKGGEGDS